MTVYMNSNQIGQRGVVILTQQLSLTAARGTQFELWGTSRYPTDRPGSSFRIPLWLRMEHNSIQVRGGCAAGQRCGFFCFLALPHV